MGIEKKSVIDLIGFDTEGRGDIEVRVARCTYVEGTLTGREPLRIRLEAGDDIRLNMASVNATLARAGFGPLPEEDVDNLEADAVRRWTPERISDRIARDEAQRLKEEAFAAGEIPVI